uniref:sn-1-specific diacylglycerol lipase ABHD11 n=1 Tax=Sphenodon punctatus TaxID=8508 RepID=A0A8D0G8F5_SPHPU
PLPLSYVVHDGPSRHTPLLLLHGLFGSKSNFQSLAKVLVHRTGRKVLTVDARNHGESPHSPLLTYEAMSSDVQHLLRQLRLNRCVVIGHTMGGKTAMALALQRPELVECLVSVDVSPTKTTAASKFPTYISAMTSVNIPNGIPRSTARRLAEEQLRPTIQEAAIRQFLLTNLVESEGRYLWRVNLEAISQHLVDIMNFPDFQLPYPRPALLGGNSSKDYAEIERLFPEAEIEYVPNAGHWVHVDQPQIFTDAICRFL